MNTNNTTEISIQVGLNGFSIFKKGISAEESFTKHLSFSNTFSKDEIIRKAAYIFEEEEVFKSSCSNCKFTFLSQKSILVPESFFEKDNLKKLFEFNQTLDELDELHYSFIPKLGIYNVFSVPNYLASIVSSKYPNVQFQHQGSILIEAARQLFQETKSDVVLLNINRNFFDLVVFDHTGLLLYNSFEFVNKTDFIYFFLYALKQLKKENLETDVIIAGEASDEKGIRKELSIYSKSIIPIEQTPLYKEAIHAPLQYRKYFSLFY